MSGAGALETLAQIVGEALEPLADRLQPDRVESTLEQLGIRLPTGVAGGGSVQSAFGDAAGVCQQFPAALAGLTAAIDSDNEAEILAAAAVLAGRIVQAVEAFVRLGTALDSAIQGIGALTAPEKASLEASFAAMPERLLHFGLLAWFEDRAPGVKHALSLAGLMEDTVIPGTNAAQPPFRRKSVLFGKIPDLLSDPADHLKQVYGFGTPTFDGLELFRRIKEAVDTRDAEAMLITLPGQPAVLEAFQFRMSVEPGAMPALRTRLRARAEKDVSESLALGGPWHIDASSKARIEGAIDTVIAPPFNLNIEPPSAAASLDVELGLRAERTDGSPMILIGEAGKSRLELGKVALSIPVSLSASSGAPSPKADVGAAFVLEGGKVAIDASEGDGFIATLLGGIKVESNFDLGARYDGAHGLQFTGSATIEIALPIHLDLGPVRIDTVYLIGGFDNGAIPVEFSADIGAALGPLQASVSRIGATANITFPSSGGKAGVAQVDLEFKAPSGVGLGLDLAVIKGGGFLYIDAERGEYAGALELVLAEMIGIQAIGLINTKMPDGSDGFSLLIMMSVDFGSGFQLGYGFTLNKVGGLVGLNRTMKLQALAEGIRSGAIMSVMFPQNIIANAPRIISDLKAFFPPQQDRFLVGPMLQIGWGTPTLISISVGVIIEIPGNIAIVGILRIALPTEEAALINLQVNFIGAIEFDKDRLWFFAALYDSRVLFLTLEGEMGLLISYGDDANFVVSVGGFHPDFSPPPLPFPSPRRIVISILSTPVSLIRVECYFAVTSNTAQFGARAELRFGLSEINVSGHIAFDALFQFSPFSFVIRISASLSVKVFGIGLFSVSISGQLDGPAPWHIVGRGEISLLFFDIGVDFETTWGEDRREELPAIAIMPLLEAELLRADNWRALPPPSTNLSVTLRSMSAEEADTILHPVGMLRVAQRKMPLGIRLDTVGTQKPNDVNKLALAVTGGGLAKKADVLDKFAPAQFQKFNDAEKLSKPAFANEVAGLDLAPAGDDMRSSRMVRRNVRYEEIILDSNFKRFRRRFSGFLGVLFNVFAKGNAAALASVSQAAKKGLNPFDDKVVVMPEGYVVALQATNQAFSAQSVFHSEASAREFLSSQVANDVALEGTLHVVPAFELAA